jgi:hypothetical protein
MNDPVKLDEPRKNPCGAGGALAGYLRDPTLLHIPLRGPSAGMLRETTLTINPVKMDSIYAEKGMGLFKSTVSGAC